MAKKRSKRRDNKPRKVWVMRVNRAGMPCVESGEFLARVKLSRFVTRTFVKDARGASLVAFDHEIFETEKAACEAAIKSLQTQIDAITTQQNYYRHRIKMMAEIARRAKRRPSDVL